VVLTTFTGISYALTYLFYAGKFFYYGLPYDFIEVNTKDVFLTILLLSPVIIYFFSGIASELKKETSNDYKTILKNDWNIIKFWKNVRKVSKKAEKAKQQVGSQLDQMEEHVNYLKKEISSIYTESDDDIKRMEKLENDVNILEKRIDNSREEQ